MKNYKKWGPIGFISIGLVCTFTAIWGHVPIIDNLNIGYRICAGVFSSIVFSGITGGVVVLVNNCCRRRIINQKGIVENRINAVNDSFMLQMVPRSTSTYTRVSETLSSPADFDLFQHAIKCNTLMDKFFQDIRIMAVDITPYLQEAERLEKLYLASPPVTQKSYIEVLRDYRYKYDQVPTAKIRNAKRDFCSSTSVEVSPIIKFGRDYSPLGSDFFLDITTPDSIPVSSSASNRTQ